MKTWLELHPHVKKTSARANSSRMLADVSVRLRIFQLLEQNGLGLNKVAKKLSGLMNYKSHYYEDGKCVLRSNIGVQLEGLTLIVRLYDSLFKSGVGLGLTQEEMIQIQQMIKDFDKKQDNF